VAAELERRWNVKLEETEQLRAILAHLKRTGRLLLGDPSGKQRGLFQ